MRQADGDAVDDGDGAQREQQPVLLQRAHGQHVVELAFNRPHRRNALDDALYLDTAAALHALSADATTRVVVLTATGERSFCSGMDVKAARSAPQLARSVRAARAFMSALMRCRKVLVAVVFGRVVGIGVTMLLHCDFVYCDSDTRFSTPFAALGIVPEFASSLTFPLFLGTQLAARMLLSGDVVDAATMSGAGVCELVHDAHVLDHVLKRCVQWTQSANQAQWNAVLEAKRLVKHATTALIERALQTEFDQIERDLRDGRTVALVRGARMSRL